MDLIILRIDYTNEIEDLVLGKVISIIFNLDDVELSPDESGQAGPICPAP